jgi:hypothetical protein
MNIKSNNIWTILFVTSLAACQHDTEVVKDNNNDILQQDTIIKQVEQWQKVTVKYHDFEGGFFGLVSATGKNLLPINLRQEYKVDGTELRVRGHIIEGMMSIQQWGVAFKIIEVDLVKTGKGFHQINSH